MTTARGNFAARFFLEKRPMTAQEIKTAVEVAAAWCGEDECSTPVEVVVFFRMPGGDGTGTKRYVGTCLEACVAFATFIATLYNDGGRLIFMEMIGGGVQRIVLGSEWETATGMKAHT